MTFYITTGLVLTGYKPYINKPEETSCQQQYKSESKAEILKSRKMLMLSMHHTYLLSPRQVLNTIIISQFIPRINCFCSKQSQMRLLSNAYDSHFAIGFRRDAVIHKTSQASTGGNSTVHTEKVNTSCVQALTACNACSSVYESLDIVKKCKCNAKNRP